MHRKPVIGRSQTAHTHPANERTNDVDEDSFDRNFDRRCGFHREETLRLQTSDHATGCDKKSHGLVACQPLISLAW